MALQVLRHHFTTWGKAIPILGELMEAASPQRLRWRFFTAALSSALIGAIMGCSHPQESDLSKQAATRKEATAILARDTQRIAKRRQTTWLSNEPLLSWSKTPLTLRLAAQQAISRQDGEMMARDLLQALLWVANSQRPLRAFVNQELQRQENRPIEWDDLALKISFWDADGERYDPPAISQLVVQRGMITTWTCDPGTRRLSEPMTRALSAPVVETASLHNRGF